MARADKPTGARARWDRLTPKQKQGLVLGGAFFALVVIVWPLLGKNEHPKSTSLRANADLSHLVTSADPRALGLSALDSDNRALRTQVDALSKSVERLSQQSGAGQNPAIEGMREQLNTLRGQVASMQGAAPSGMTPGPASPSTPAAPTGGVPSAAPGASSTGTPAAMPTASLAPPAILTTDEDPKPDAAASLPDGAGKKDASAKAPAKEQGSYIPSGSMITGVLINGMDAPTGRAASGQPQPVLVRVKREAILPNRFRADVRECFVIAAGYGDLSSERAYLRAESFSCVRNDGKVIDTKIEAYAVGEDGKAGVRGRLVSKQGSAIAKAMVAGFAQSYAQALSPGYGYAGGALQGAGIGAAGVEAGAYGGASSALDRIAKFYIDLANQMFPVVEIDAGRPVTLIVLHGSQLALAAGR